MIQGIENKMRTAGAEMCLLFSAVLYLLSQINVLQ